MTQKNNQTDPLDPFAMWRTMRDQSLENWSKIMIDTVNSEAYARATGNLLESTLATSAPFRTMIENAMNQVMTQLNLPLRTDVTSLAERLTHIEMRLDDIEAKLDTFERSARPRRSEKASAAEEQV